MKIINTKINISILEKDIGYQIGYNFSLNRKRFGKYYIISKETKNTRFNMIQSVMDRAILEYDYRIDKEILK